MSLYVNNAGTWTISKDIYVFNGTAWFEPSETWINDNGTWKIVHKVINISASVNDVNLYTLAGSPASPLRLKVNIASGITIGASSTANPALTVGSFVSGSEILLTNNGTISGAGGVGAQASNYGAGFVNSAGSGGPGVSTGVPITIANNGTINGGGGGGGQGGWGTFRQTVTSGKTSTTYTYSTAGGGGGGGAGVAAGGGGTGGQGANYNGGNGLAGSATTGGAGGAAGGSGAGYGGAGGGPGVAGGSGQTVGSYWSTGGAAGNYIVGNSYVTWAATGTRNGGVA